MKKEPRARGVNRLSQTTERTGVVSVTATEAQNEFGRILDTVAQDRLVIITRHNTPRAVLMSLDRFDALSRAGEAVLDRLTGEFDALLERMQTPEARAGVRRAFGASPDELGRAAVAAAERRSDG
jgi:prevent-host-death family protein